jgi:hypothetical protein
MTAMSDPEPRVRGGRMRIPRSRGALSGIVVILLGIWGAAVPFVGPSFDFAYSLQESWSIGRGWLEVLPGVVAVIGGFLLLTSRNRATGMLGGWLAVAAGAWFVVGRAFAGPLGLGNVGTPVADTDTKRVWLELTYFYGLGAIMIFFGAMALGRLSVRSVRDVEFVNRPMAHDRGMVTTQDTVTTDPTGAPVVTDGRRPGLKDKLFGSRRNRGTRRDGTLVNR